MREEMREREDLRHREHHDGRGGVAEHGRDEAAVCECVRACARVCLSVCVQVCVRACVRACEYACAVPANPTPE
jgi:hypothetical protein